MLDARGGASKAEGFSGRAGCLPGGWGTGESRKMVLGGKGKERDEVDRGGKGGENRGQVFPLGSRAGQTVGEELSSLLPEKKHTLLLPWEMGGRGVPRAPALSAQ